MNMHTTPIRCTCPTCGGYIGEIPNPDKVREVLTSQERVVFDELMKAMPEGVDTITLATALFGPKQGVEEHKINHAMVLVSRLRRSIERFGYMIPRNKALHRGTYKIVPMEAGA